MKNDPSKILFVINPVSGGKFKPDWETVISTHFKSLPHQIELYFLEGTPDPASVNERINALSPGKVVAVGGDGTVSLVAKLILKTPVALGILPAGSANGMAKELNIPSNIQEALDLIVNGQTKACDAIRINQTHICLHLSDIGLNAKLIKYFEEGKLRGKLGYASVLLKTLARKTRMNVSIEMEGRSVSHKAFMVVLANASKYGTGAVINPHGDLYDGLFEVVIVRRLALSELFKMIFKPQPFDPKKIQLYQANAVTITTARAVHFQVDGEYLGKVKQVDALMLKGELNLIVPQSVLPENELTNP